MTTTRHELFKGSVVDEKGQVYKYFKRILKHRDEL